MSFSAKNRLIGHNQLINSIISFSDSVTRYLSPIIRFVGHKDEYYDSLYRKFPDLKHEKRYSGDPAHLVIFDEIPYSYLTHESALSPAAAYVFCLDHKPNLNDEQRSVLRKRVSGTLINPTVDELYWHMKALLLIQDMSFSNGLHSYPELMSIDVAFRRTLSELIFSSINLQSCITRVPSTDVSQSIEALLFDSLPSSISPYKVSMERLDTELLPDDRVSFLSTECTTLKSVDDVLDTLKPAINAKPLIALLDTEECHQCTASDSIPTLALSNLYDRHLDAQLIAYWCCMNRSSEQDHPYFYSTIQIEEALKTSEGNALGFISAILSTEPELKHPDKGFIDLLSQYDRPSIDDVFDEAERRVMLNLHRRAAITDAASNAAGIPSVTFRKRRKRLSARKSLIRLISDVRHDT